MDMNQITNEEELQQLSFDRFKEEVLKDYRMVCVSREVSLLGRKEVLTGKAKFGIFGGGKEVAQVAMAKYFMPGDFRAGYYRDQTFMFASNLATVEDFFAQLYADPEEGHDPFSGGRQMNCHFATPFVDENGKWLPLTQMKNISADIAPTGGQMPRALGLAYASRAFRNIPELGKYSHLSNNGNEICFCTIGDASTSEGHFWEAVNAAGVMQIPLAIFIWDDGYGISVPKKVQTVKASISAALAGMQKKQGSNGLNIYQLKGWDYAGMCEVLEEAIRNIRETHVPAIFHVEECTQPQGHSTSGSHERYKSRRRLEWEKEWDCKKQMREWIVSNSLATTQELDDLEDEAKKEVRDSKNRAWNRYLTPVKNMVSTTVNLLTEFARKNNSDHSAMTMAKELKSQIDPQRATILSTLFRVIVKNRNSPHIADVQEFYDFLQNENKGRYNSHLYAEGDASALNVKTAVKKFRQDAPKINGFELLNRYFDRLFATNDKVLAFGEDVGQIGDVNQGFSGLQQKYGDERIFDTGIRELSIIGQGIGMALRGLRPIAEIQYLDYLLFGLQPLSDDVATTHYRTKGKQSCPIIVRTRGHRLEGIWHSGSPMGMIIHALRGIYVCVPRNMTQAIGFYNTLLRGNDPGIVIECLNGYRLKEKEFENLLDYTVALGVPEILRTGTDITIVSYGSTLRVVEDAAELLETMDISCEVMDVQTLLPFDTGHKILESLKKTNRILFVDEDVPGGASAYMFNHVMEEQGGYRWLDVKPRTLTAKAHRPAYGTDGDYFSKPNAEEIIQAAVEMMAE